MSIREVSAVPRIRFIIPYFGEWPFWMPFFIKSCSYNPSIEWLFYTDCGEPENTPPNVVFRNCTYRDYCEFVSERLEIDFKPPNPYKLCDIKPALGYIHSADLEGYDFWAFGDIDVVYGDLREYFTPGRLAGKDLFATHTRRISGHLCIMRNTQMMREAFKEIPRWQQRYADPQHQALDEGAFSRLFIKHKNWPKFLQNFAALFNHWNRRSEFIEAHSTFTVLSDGTRVNPERWCWKSGELTNSELGGRSLPYCHFLIWKNEHWRGSEKGALLGPDSLAAADSWCITVNGWRDMS